jgi:hypothetical protein
VFLLLAAALAAVPAPSAEEAQALGNGEVVVRAGVPTIPGAVAVVGIAWIDAPEEPIWSALLDFPARMEGNSSLRSVAAYQPATAREQWVRWEVVRFGVHVVYHNHYVVDRAGRTLLHELDPTMPNDLRASRGLFELTPHGAGFQLAYTAETDFGRAVPSFITAWLSDSGVRTFLEDVVKRAERR